MRLKKCILVTGGFDPIHAGHIAYFSEAKKICDYLVIGINSDKWLIRKKGTNFYDWSERELIIKQFKEVDKVIGFNDDDGSALAAIKKCLNFSEKVIFANGGDRGESNIPEIEAFKDNDSVEFMHNVGGSKKLNSSSSILENYYKKSFKIDYELNPKNSEGNDKGIFFSKPWGKYRILSSGNKYKVKDIFIEPMEKLSLQFHHKRSEHWVIVSGVAKVQLDDNVYDYSAGDHIYVRVGQKHRITNTGNQTLILIEVALGEYIEEDDIVRVHDIYDRK
jgi:cytidyltransferase-like protein